MSEENKYAHKIWTIPNILSMFRLVLIPVIVWLYCFRQDYYWTAGVLFLSGVTDVVDGFIARKFKMISEFGKALDPIADKFTQGITLFCLATRFPHMLFPPLLMAVKEVVMFWTGFLAAKKTGHVHGAEWHGKLNTVLLYAMMMIHILWPAIPLGFSFFSVGVCVMMIILSFILYYTRNIDLIKKGEQAK